MHDAAGDIPGYNLTDTALGPALTTSVTNTAAGPATLQWTQSAGGATLEWISAPLASAAMISGTITFNAWAMESSSNANACVRATVQRYTTSEQAAFASQTDATELTTAISQRTFTASGYTPTATPTATASRTPTPTPLLPDGDACSISSQCQSMECVDGVCCDTPCDGPNEICNLPGREGTCLPKAVAPAPLLSGLGTLIAFGVLLFTAAVALRRRSKD